MNDRLFAFYSSTQKQVCVPVFRVKDPGQKNAQGGVCVEFHPDSSFQALIPHQARDIHKSKNLGLKSEFLFAARDDKNRNNLALAT